MQYYVSLANDAINDISKFGDFDAFVSEEPLNTQTILYDGELVYSEIPNLFMGENLN